MHFTCDYSIGTSLHSPLYFNYDYSMKLFDDVTILIQLIKHCNVAPSWSANEIAVFIANLIIYLYYGFSY